MLRIVLIAALSWGCSKAPEPPPRPRLSAPPATAPDAARAAPEVPVNPRVLPVKQAWGRVPDDLAGSTLRRAADALAGRGSGWAQVRPFIAPELCFGEDDTDATEDGVTSGLRCASGAAVDEAADLVVDRIRGLGRVECSDSLCVERAGSLESWYALRARAGRVFVVGVFERDRETTDDRAWEGEDRHAAWRAALTQRFGR